MVPEVDVIGTDGAEVVGAWFLTESDVVYFLWIAMDCPYKVAWVHLHNIQSMLTRHIHCDQIRTIIRNSNTLNPHRLWLQSYLKYLFACQSIPHANDSVWVLSTYCGSLITRHTYAWDFVTVVVKIVFLLDFLSTEKSLRISFKVQNYPHRSCHINCMTKSIKIQILTGITIPIAISIFQFIWSFRLFRVNIAVVSRCL